MPSRDVGAGRLFGLIARLGDDAEVRAFDPRGQVLPPRLVAEASAESQLHRRRLAVEKRWQPELVLRRLLRPAPGLALRTGLAPVAEDDRGPGGLVFEGVASAAAAVGLVQRFERGQAASPSQASFSREVLFDASTDRSLFLFSVQSREVLPVLVLGRASSQRAPADRARAGSGETTGTCRAAPRSLRLLSSLLRRRCGSPPLAAS